MTTVVDVTLNVAAGVICAVLIVTSVRPDLVRLTAILYAAFFVLMFLVPDGGQVNVAIALGLFAFTLLGWVGDDKDLPSAVVQQRERVAIFDGIMTAKTNIARQYNTYDPTSSTYKRLPRSINRLGGAQFSYSIWVMFEKGVTDDDVAGKTLFMRGDKKQFKPLTTTRAAEEVPSENYFKHGDGRDFTIACPRVSFLTANMLAVDVNTDRELRHRFAVGSEASGVEMRKNALSLIPGHFAMLTFVFEDNIAIDGFERGIRFKFYVNDQLYHTSTAPGALRQNNGPVHMFLDEDPDGNVGIDACRVADFTYYNYALRDNEVAAAFGKGFNNKQFTDRNTIFSKDIRLNLTSYNKTDLYNYDSRLHKYPH